MAPELEESDKKPSAAFVTKQLTNRERLLQHLPPGSFALRLATAQGAEDPAASLKKAIAERFDQARSELDSAQA